MAALIVVFTHFAAAFYPYSLFGDRYQYKQISAIELMFNQGPLGLLLAGHFAVSLFFILSGYVLSYKYVGREKMRVRLIAAMLKRPVRLGGVVLFTIILSYILMSSGLYHNRQVALYTSSIPWFERYWEIVPPLKTFLADLLLRPFSRGLVYNAPLWTLKWELYGSYLVFAYLFFVGNFKYRIVLLSFLIYVFSHSYYLCFLLGILFAEVEAILIARNWRIPDYFLLAIFPLGLFLSSRPNYVANITLSNSIYGWLPAEFNTFSKGGYAVIGAIMVFACVLFCTPLQALLDKSVLRYLGRISYTLYALHFIFLGSISSFLYYILVERIGHNAAFWCAFLLSFPLYVLGADLSNRWVDANAVRFSNWLGKRCEDFIYAQRFNAKKQVLVEGDIVLQKHARMDETLL